MQFLGQSTTYDGAEHLALCMWCTPVISFTFFLAPSYSGLSDAFNRWGTSLEPVPL